MTQLFLFGRDNDIGKPLPPFGTDLQVTVALNPAQTLLKMGFQGKWGPANFKGLTYNLPVQVVDGRVHLIAGDVAPQAGTLDFAFGQDAFSQSMSARVAADSNLGLEFLSAIGTALGRPAAQMMGAVIFEEVADWYELRAWTRTIMSFDVNGKRNPDDPGTVPVVRLRPDVAHPDDVGAAFVDYFENDESALGKLTNIEIWQALAFRKIVSGPDFTIW